MKNHLKRLATPRSWTIKRKASVFITRPNPGKHSLKLSLPLSIMLKEFIKVVRTTKEAKKLLNNKEVQIDNKRVKEIKTPVGFMDTITLKDLNKYYRTTLNEKGRIDIEEIKKEEAALKTCKIIGKKKLKGKKTQLNLFDGRNILVEKDEYKVGDSIIIELPSQKIKKSFKLEKGANIFLAGGKHAGKKATIEAIKPKHLIYTTKEGRGVTLKKYGFVIEK